MRSKRLVVSDDAENRKISKDKPSARVDGIVAATMGAGLIARAAEAQTETPGIQLL